MIMKTQTEACHCGCCYSSRDVVASAAEAAAAIDSANLMNSTFSIDGLDCADCAAKLEKGIRKLPGVREAQVNFAAAKLKVVYDKTLLEVAQITKTVSGFGYSAAILQVAQDAPGYHTSVFRITGMDCADCAAKLEKKITALAGVRSATVNFGAGKLTVEHALTESKIIKAVQQAGYQAVSDGQAARPGAQPAGAWWRKPRVMATSISGVALLAAILLDWVGMSKNIIIPLYFAAIAVGGYHVAKSGLYGLKSLTMDTNFLMTIAVVGAVAIGEWSEGATVVFLFSLGNALQAYTLDKTRESIRSLMDLAPREALVRRDGQELRLSVAEIVVGDIILVKPGERIAMDGNVVNGISTVNQAPITGESMPVEKQVGDLVYAGTVNEQGALEIAVTKLTADSTLAKIMHMVEEAQADKAPMQQFVDIFAKYYTPAVILASLGLMFIPSLVFNQSFDLWFYRALVLLVISCPCALVISTPVSIVSAIGNASRRGVLVKGGAYLEQMGRIQAVAFDKTGTLTIGKPMVTDVTPLTGIAKEELLLLATAVERWSEHPLAQAIVAKAGNAPLKSVTKFKALIGRGAQANIGDQTVYVGNRRLFEEIGHALASYEEQLIQLEQQGKTVMLVGTKQQVLGAIAVADTLRANSRKALAALQAAGVENMAMLTGDNKRVAAAIADKLNIDAFYSELLPEDKVLVLKQLAHKYGSVAMVGDGVNDAPAMATATVGIAMGVAGSDTALETADIALMSDDLSKLAYVMKLSRKTVAIIKQNVTFSLVIKLLFVLGTFAGFVNLWLAVLADTGASLLVTLNGMRLAREIKIPERF
ncbi:Lead, cadmium, zinc and mercury transporting ATPase; Copper-translocating P-type ATPase [Sporomusa ovata]|uniref:Cd(2+)-exporting ATPase n=1 Tax=Sporomusa ovata TaxID=2378 RepID=A0A0U1L1T0_9FIRM|nr:Lead, cadmium, zinc and mercury transporting ATPase; Copper-translocating P-type ATPase [Sporomusa ovata]